MRFAASFSGPNSSNLLLCSGVETQAPEADTHMGLADHADLQLCSATLKRLLRVKTQRANTHEPRRAPSRLPREGLGGLLLLTR